MFIETKQAFRDRFFTNYDYSIPAKSGRPYLNVPQIGFSTFANQSVVANKKTIMEFVKRSSEALGIVRAIAQDIITKLEFKSIIQQGKGRPSPDVHNKAEEKARNFAKLHQVKQTLLASVMDWLITGESFIWIGEDYTEKVKEITEKTIKELFPDNNLSEKELKELIDNFEEDSILTKQKNIDEDPDGLKQLVYVPSSTVSIKINEEGTGIERYRQDTNLRVREWLPNQIIHAKFLDLDGKINGYSPMEAAIPLIKTLGLITDYHGNFFDSGGTPDLIFIFKQLGANDPALQKWQQVIDEWGQTKRRGHLVIGGEDFALERANEMQKDMEFRKLAIYYTGRLAFSFGMPLEKLQAILGGEIKSSTGSSELGNADYMRNISDAQDYWENILNTQFWNDSFKVDMNLVRGFLQDQVRKLQVDSQRIAVINGLIKYIKPEKISELIHLHFPDVDRNWLKDENEMELDFGVTANTPLGILPSSQVVKGEARQAYSEEKKKQQEPQQRTNKPIGS